MNSNHVRTILSVLIATAAAVTGRASESEDGLVTPLVADDLDQAAFEQWVDGAANSFQTGPRHVVWTRNSRPEWDGLKFGQSKTTGIRHMRIGLKRSIAIGTVLTRSGGALSVLKEDASYPGKMNDESLWTPAQRIAGREVTRKEATGDAIALWTLPPGTSTRALRFTHTPTLTDKDFAGWLGGVSVIPARVTSLSSQATTNASVYEDTVSRIVDGNHGQYWFWDNGPNGAEQVISPTNAEWVTLSWSKPVTLSGLAAIFPGFGTAEAQVYAGPRHRPISEAKPSDWETIKSFSGIENWYPLQLCVNWLDFGKTVTTNAIRLRLTSVSAERHPHVQGRSKGGKGVWLGELLALSPVDGNNLAAAIIPEAKVELQNPPIPIKFTLRDPAYVTLVIEDESGKRIRNLVSETPFPAGRNTAWWDGLDDLGRDTEAAKHGIYNVPGEFVKPGSYTVRGLFREDLDLHFEFSVYNAGNPAWTTADGTGGWTTNHTAPCCVEFVPGSRAPGGKPLIFIGSFVSEGGHGLMWVDQDGKKVGGRATVGGGWTGARVLAQDRGNEADEQTYLYVAADWEGALRLTALTHRGDKGVASYKFKTKEETSLAGMAVHNQLMVCSLPKTNQLLFIDVKAGSVLGTARLDDPSGVAFDRDGNFLAFSGSTLMQYSLPEQLSGDISLPRGKTLVTNLDDPKQMAFDTDGNIYVSVHGERHQVMVFTSSGRRIRSIGRSGAPKAGRYDPLHMNSPMGLTIDEKGQLWVAEEDFQPKRVSVWTLRGKLVDAFYGPSMYGGGGKLDPKDKTKFYFHGMEFKLDWNKGTNVLSSVFYRPGPEDQKMPDSFGCNGMPEYPHYFKGKKYFSNWHNCNPTNGAAIASIWVERDGVAHPVAMMGSGQSWGYVKEEPFASRWPAGVQPKGNWWQNQTLFVWSDTSGDAHMQPEELTFMSASAGGAVVMDDLSILVARVNGSTMKYSPVRFAGDVPVYDLKKGEVLASDVQGSASSGGDQALTTEDGWTVLTIAAKPFAQHSLSGTYKGEPKWSYPSLWPGLHASHEAPAPEFPGELIGTTRLLGGFVTPRKGDAGPLWAVNGNMGPIYLFTADGLFVASLFKDVRQGHSWSMPIAPRNMRMNDVSLHDENFWPSMTQTPDGNVYLVDGGRTSLVRVDGLDKIRRIPPFTVRLSERDLVKAREFGLEREAARQKLKGTGRLAVVIRREAPKVDGKLDDWQGVDWAPVDKRGVGAWFDSNSKPYNVSAAVAVAGDKLYVAYRTNEKDLLRNSGEMVTAPFKTGGALDLMIGTNPRANPTRKDPVEGDIRLLVTKVKDQTRALVYRAVVPGTAEPVPFSSPWRTVTIDKVDDVTSSIELASSEGLYEFSVPLKTLGLSPRAGMDIKADVGVLRGDGMHTLQRVYWCNKGTAITSDVPSEAMLTPQLWGIWAFAKE